MKHLIKILEAVLPHLFAWILSKESRKRRKEKDVEPVE